MDTERLRNRETERREKKGRETERMVYRENRERERGRDRERHRHIGIVRETEFRRDKYRQSET